MSGPLGVAEHPRRRDESSAWNAGRARRSAALAAFLAAWSAGIAPSLDAQNRMPRTPALQALTVIPRADLRFGSVIRGHGSVVSARDEGRAALFEVQGPGGTPVRVEFLLPASLLSEGGVDLRLEFGPGDGFAQLSAAHPPHGDSFNPRNPLIAYLSGEGRLYLHVGGTAVARMLQPGGTYRAAILITLYDLSS